MPSRVQINWRRVDHVWLLSAIGLVVFALLDHDWNAALAWATVSVFVAQRIYAGGGDRTPTSSRPPDLESGASTSSATPANEEATP